MQLYFYNGQPTTYSITTSGELYNSKTDKWLKGQTNKNGYITYNISFNNIKKRLYAHRMVMETYLPNKNSNNLEVNHINGKKNDNRLENLEWMTPRENKQHAIDNNLASSCYKKVYCYNLNKELIAEYKSISTASQLTGYSISTITMACNTKIKIAAYQLYWSFEELPYDFEVQNILTGKAKTVGKYSKENFELLEIYPSMSEAARKNNLGRPHIGECCNGKIKSYGGFIWKFI